MCNKTHVGFVDPHAEGNGCHDYHAVFIDKTILVPSAHGCVQTGMIGKRWDASACKRGSGFIHFRARETVHDARVSSMALGDESLELRSGVLLLDDLITNIRSIKARNKAGRVVKFYAGNDIATCEFICCCS